MYLPTDIATVLDLLYRREKGTHDFWVTMPKSETRNRAIIEYGARRDFLAYLYASL